MQVQARQKIRSAQKKSQRSRMNYQKILNQVYDTICEKQYYANKHITNSQLHRMKNFDQIIPKSLPKLLAKELSIVQSEYSELSRQDKKYKVTKSIACSGINKTINKTLEEEQKKQNKDNMNMLGLDIKKIQYCDKNQKKFNLIFQQNIEHQEREEEDSSFKKTIKLQLNCNSEIFQFPLKEDFQKKKNIMTTREIERRKAKYNKTKNPFRLRQKSAASTIQARKKSINPEYQNPIYVTRIESYREFIFKANFSYKIFTNTEKYDHNNLLKTQEKYRAWIGKGNNGNLIRSLIQRRFWWIIVDDKKAKVNFLWTQLKNNQYFKKQKSLPLWFLTEHHQKKKYLQNENVEVFKYESSKQLRIKRFKKSKSMEKKEQLLQKILNHKDTKEYKEIVKLNKLQNKSYEECKVAMNLSEITTHQQFVHNHLINNFFLGNKKALFYNLKQYYQLTDGNLFKVVPLTFHIKTGFKDQQYKRFITYHKKRQLFIKKQQKVEQNQEPSSKRKMRNIWIVKPGELTNRGNGITVIDEIYELNAIMKLQKEHDNGAEKTFIVQLYLDRPFLYKRRKFDIRHFMLITHLHGVMKAYWYKQGYIRTSSSQFDIQNFERQIHLTNDAIQKYTPNYGRYQPANKISYNQFQKYLDSTYPKKKYNFNEQIGSRMKQIAKDTVHSSFLKLSPQRLKHNFEIFGFDFMIDSQFKVWLIEINTNPCLEIQCPLLSRILPNMLDQAFRLSLDLLYPPPCHYPNTAKHLVPDCSLENFNYELIFDQKTEGEQIRTLYKHSKSNLLAEIGDISEDQVFQDQGKNVCFDEITLE